MAEVNTYKRSLGLFELVSLGVGGTVGVRYFVVQGIAARQSGPWSGQSCFFPIILTASYHFRDCHVHSLHFICPASWMLVTDIKSRLGSAAAAVSTPAILLIYFTV
jgi:hypothetical protein